MEDSEEDFNIDIPGEPDLPVVTDEMSRGHVTLLKQSVENGTYGFSGNIDIDAVLFGSKWNVSTLSYQFAASSSDMSSWRDARDTALVPFTDLQRQAVHQILRLVSSYTLLTFTDDPNAGASDAVLKFAQSTRGVDSAEAHVPAFNDHSGEVWIRDFASRSNPYYTDDPRLGNSGFSTVMHEVGHALGLKHGHQDYSQVNLGSSFGLEAIRRGSDRLPLDVDGQDWSLMTYTSAPSSGEIEYVAGDAVQSYMQCDIAALQYLYGANFSSHSGDTTYRWNETTGEFFIDGQSQGAPTADKIAMTIWDGDGIDTYDLSKYSSNLTVDLNPGSFSTFSDAQLIDHTDTNRLTVKARGNIANALLHDGDRRSLIENVNGGSGSDTIIGNGTNNALDGGAGDDLICGRDDDDAVSGGAGNDFGSGGFGNDTVLGEAGNDLVFGDDDDDLVDGNDGDDLVYGGTGTDTVFGSAGIDQVYGEDGNDFVGTGAGNDFGSGGFGNDEVHGEEGNDLLFGDEGNDGVYGEDGDDLVYGGTGNDYVTGDAGNDRVFGEDGNDGLSGGAGDDTLDGGAGTDLLFGNAGDDILTGGAGADIFAFGRGDGRDAILDFVTGGSETDVIAFEGGVFADFAAVQAASRQDGADVVIAYGTDDVLTLRGVQLATLSAANVSFA